MALQSNTGLQPLRKIQKIYVDALIARIRQRRKDNAPPRDVSLPEELFLTLAGKHDFLSRKQNELAAELARQVAYVEELEQEIRSLNRRLMASSRSSGAPRRSSVAGASVGGPASPPGTDPTS